MITVTRSTELEEWAREARRRFEAGDSAWFEETTAYGDVGGFGTAEEERSIGRDEVLALTKSQIDEMHEASGLDMAEAAENPDEDLMEGYQAGDVGWIVTHGRFTFEDGSWTANRIVSVVVRDAEDGGWKSVLTTSQVLVPNELLLPGSPLRTPAET
jgi:hypothetical protein